MDSPPCTPPFSGLSKKYSAIFASLGCVGLVSWYPAITRILEAFIARTRYLASSYVLSRMLHAPKITTDKRESLSHRAVFRQFEVPTPSASTRSIVSNFPLCTVALTFKRSGFEAPCPLQYRRSISFASSKWSSEARYSIISQSPSLYCQPRL